MLPPRPCPKLDGTIAADHLLLPMKSVSVAGFSILPIPLSHDAKNTVGFVVNDGHESLAYITDTGFIAEKLFPAIKGETYYIFESNHDPEMLFNSGRPDYLIRPHHLRQRPSQQCRQRLLSGQSHHRQHQGDRPRPSQ
jgi:phosphoribosyl 1,2-cyclic phosphodiesterase